MTKRYKFKVCFDFTFFAVVAFLVFVDTQGTAVLSLIACMLHEGGHLLAMAVCCVPPEKITFYGGGIAIRKDLDGCSFLKQLFILSAGCAVNLLTALSCLVFLPDSEYAEVFAAVNILILAFNLLPLGCFDGAQILETVSVRFFGYTAAVIIKRTLGIVFSVLLIVGVLLYSFYYKEAVSLSLAFAVLYLLIAQFIE